jgi:hypothetical protein
LTRSGSGLYFPGQMLSRRRSAGCALAVLGLALLAACTNSLGLPAAQITNKIDTVTLYALSGTPFTTPSAYALNGALIVRTDQTTVFDFAFNIIDPLNQAVLLPSGALRLPRTPGLQRSSSAFNTITTAPVDGYELDNPVVVDTGVVLVVRSRALTCADGTTESLYAKLRVLALDLNPAVRTIRFEILVDQNCGYIGLEPGLPTR